MIGLSSIPARGSTPPDPESWAWKSHPKLLSLPPLPMSSSAFSARVGLWNGWHALDGAAGVGMSARVHAHPTLRVVRACHPAASPISSPRSRVKCLGRRGMVALLGLIGGVSFPSVELLWGPRLRTGRRYRTISGCRDAAIVDAGSASLTLLETQSCEMRVCR